MIAIEPESKEMLGMSISKERKMFVVELFLYDIVVVYGQYPVSTDGGTRYPQTCKFLKMKQNHNFHSPFEKSIIERSIQYLKDEIIIF